MSMPYRLTRNQLDYQDVSQTKADLKAEMHFIGQIVGELDFQTDDQLFCELAIDCRDGWDLLQPGNNKGIQTQTSYANPGQLFSCSYPFDLHFSVSKIIGWPKAYQKPGDWTHQIKLRLVVMVHLISKIPFFQIITAIQNHLNTFYFKQNLLVNMKIIYTAIFPRSSGYHQMTWYQQSLFSETWTPTEENLDLEIRKPNEDLATNTDQFKI